MEHSISQYFLKELFHCKFDSTEFLLFLGWYVFPLFVLLTLKVRLSFMPGSRTPPFLTTQKFLIFVLVVPILYHMFSSYYISFRPLYPFLTVIFLSRKTGSVKNQEKLEEPSYHFEFLGEESYFTNLRILF